MRRLALPLLGLGCALALVLVCFHAVLLRGEQFAYRDAGHFYYPLYLRVQQEWNAGRVPLWEPGRNGGAPLLGMPMAAVLYPGKVLYAIMPYAWAARLYVVGHVAIAFFGMVLLARSLGISGVGACLSGLAYAFGAPILFQYSNVIYLVGAAWVPWGLRAGDRLLRLRRRSGLLELAAVLALQTLGGDPEGAYLVVAVAAVEGLVLSASLGNGLSWLSARWRWLLSAGVVVWFGATLVVAWASPRAQLPAWLCSAGMIRGIVGGLVGGACLVVWVRNRWQSRLGPMLAALVGAATLAIAIAAVQLAPSWELARVSTRGGENASGDLLDFSVEPYRLLEAAWPYVFGLEGPENSAWIQAIPPAGARMFWSPSLYLGGLTLVLALAAFGRDSASPVRTWLALVVVGALVAGMGKFAGPLWLSRWIPAVADAVGPHDPPSRVERSDPYPTDGAGSPYALLAATIPGFSLFRYPAKLITFTCVALAGLAGIGWDRFARGHSRLGRWVCRCALLATLIALPVAVAARLLAVEALSKHVPRHTLFGPVDVARGLNETIRGLGHGGVIYAAIIGVIALAGRRPRLAGSAALLLMTIDLLLANSRLVWTVSQVEFDREPAVARLIDDAEKANPSEGPFRIHRVEQWHPGELLRRSSRARLAEVVAWERGTLDRLYALPEGLEYTVSRGLIDVGEFNEFFEIQMMAGRDSQGGSRPILIHPRRGFDLWNARYFVMPVEMNGWMGEDKGFTRLYPPDEVVNDPERSRRWIAREGWQLLRNQNAFPRAWIVHQMSVRKPNSAASDEERAALMQSLVVQSDPLTSGTGRPVNDLRALAFVESDEPWLLSARLPGGPTGPTESVTVTSATPQRVEIRAVLDRPGLVVLADTHYPGWRLTVDGVPASILRTNRLMRGALVPEGTHTLIYSYDPASFRVGASISAFGLALMLGLVPWAMRSSLST